jgi:mannose-1-phosphate guanylyltransferase
MNALLLAAGFGTRLRPLTEHTPKCLVEIAGRPLLDYWLHDLHEAGITGFLLNTHHLADKVADYVSTHPLREKISLTYEPTLLGTAGTLLANQAFLEDAPCLVAHADNLCLCDWRCFINAHRQRPAESLLTMMTFQTHVPRECGIVELDEQGIVRAFHEKVTNPPGNLANAAVYQIDPGFLSTPGLFGPETTDLSTQVLPFLLGRISTWENKRVLIDIGTPERLAEAQTLV